MPSPLWSPSSERIMDSRFQAFTSLCQGRYDYPGPQSPTDLYAGLHEWSVSHPKAFWRAIWEFGDIIGDPGSEVLGDCTSIENTKWFPGAQLNFAENLLRPGYDGLAIIERGEDGRRVEIRYSELRSEVAALAYQLKQLGVCKGDRVAGFLPNSTYAIVSMLAAASLGAIWSSCSPDFGFQGVLDRFAQISPKVLIACDGYQYATKQINTLDRVEEISEALGDSCSLIVAPYQNEARATAFCEEGSQRYLWGTVIESGAGQPLIFEPMSFSDPLYILYSSGTTGKPKCIVHSVGGTLIQHIKELAIHSNVKENTRLFYFTTCGWMMWNWLVSGLALGATLVLYDGSPFHPKQSILWDIAEEEKIEVFGASAKYYAACEKYDLKPSNSHCLEALEALLSTGSPLSHESFEYLYREVKADVCVSSISGGTDIVSCFALGAPVLPVYKGELQCPGLGMAVAFYDEQGNPLSGGKGELVCEQAFPSMPVGFWNDPEGERFHDAYFARFDNVWAHGDYGEFINHGQAPHPAQKGIIIHGRSDAVLNPGGVRIGTAEIYRQVEKVDAVFESLAVGQQWGDDIRVVLFVRLKEGHQLDEGLIQEIKQTIRANTTPRHVPAKVLAVQDIPRTLSGKIVELAVRKIVHGEEVKNKEALANPEALDLFKDLPELST